MHDRSRPRVAILNGFLGAGKTTTIAALARMLVARGMTPAVVTNDQAAGLVDTETVRTVGVAVAEVTAGCFCCHFSDLVVAMDQLLAHEPDVILCEAVGSCTDIVSTVVRPLQRFYGHDLDVAPFAVVVDGGGARELLEAEPIEELRYLRAKQIAEADVVLSNKIDEADAPLELLARLAPGRRVIPISAQRGDGMAEVLELLLTEEQAGLHPLQEIDYDTYARAEELLAWLNATVRVSGTVDVARLVTELARGAAQTGEALHVKAAGAGMRAHLTRAGDEPFVTDSNMAGDMLTLNARIRCDASRLRSVFDRLAREQRLDVVSVEAFHPAYPRPEHRLT